MLDPRTVGLRGALNAINRRRLHLGRETLVDRVLAPTLLMDIVLVLAGAALVSLAAQFVVPLWPVPSTGQIVGVLVVGYSMGALRGGLALLIYVSLGALGVPVFNQGGAGWAHLMGDTGGYLVGFVGAAVLAGLCAEHRWDRRVLSNFVCSLALMFVVYAVGVIRLADLRAYGIADALADGFYPLVAAGVVKVLVVALIVPLGWRLDAGRTRSVAPA